MDLIERYVQEVARRLPRKQRDDVARELRSALEDSIESRTGVPLDRVDEEQAVDLLLEFGSPQEVAASYRSGPDHLIGPALYPSFIKTMKVCLAVVGGLLLLSALLDMVGSSGAFGELGSIGLRLVSNLQSTFIGLLGLVVLIFAIIERASTPEKQAEEEWDPRELPAMVEDQDRVDRTGTIIGMVFAGVGLWIISFRPEWMRAMIWVNDEHYRLPLFGPGAYAQIIWLKAFLLLVLVLGVVTLLQGRWNAGTRAADFAVSLLVVIFFWRLLNSAQPLLPDEAALLELGWSAEQATDIAELIREIMIPMTWWVCLAGFLATGWSSISKLIALVRSVTGQRPVPVS